MMYYAILKNGRKKNLPKLPNAQDEWDESHKEIFCEIDFIPTHHLALSKIRDVIHNYNGRIELLDRKGTKAKIWISAKTLPQIHGYNECVKILCKESNIEPKKQFFVPRKESLIPASITGLTADEVWSLMNDLPSEETDDDYVVGVDYGI